jgi:hypothetical protein
MHNDTKFWVLLALSLNGYQFFQIINQGIQISYSSDINRFVVNLFFIALGCLSIFYSVSFAFYLWQRDIETAERYRIYSLYASMVYIGCFYFVLFFGGVEI